MHYLPDRILSKDYDALGLSPDQLDMLEHGMDLILRDRDIRRGTPKDCSQCPAALALHRAWDADYVEVSHNHVRVFVKDVRIACATPARLEETIETYDDLEEWSDVLCKRTFRLDNWTAEWVEVDG